MAFARRQMPTFTQETSMSPEQKKFFRMMMHSAARSLMNRAMWTLPWQVAVALFAIVIGIIVYFGIY